MLRLGVDIGGTKTEAVVLKLIQRGDVNSFEELARIRRPTSRDMGYEHIVENTAKLIEDVAKEAGLQALPKIGVGMPGSTTRWVSDGVPAQEPLVKNSNSTMLNGRPFHGDLRRRLGTDIVFANDANCFALAEAVFGVGRHAQVLFGVIMGTGVGGGIAFRSPSGLAHVWEGQQGIAGEWGHVALEPVNGPPCYCGKRGCIEQYLSGPPLERKYKELTGEDVLLADIAARADAGEAAATELLTEFSTRFAQAIACIINVLDPSMIVLGGGVSNLKCIYEIGRKELAKWVFCDIVDTLIVKHSLGDSAGVLGAAMLPG